MVGLLRRAPAGARHEDRRLGRLLRRRRDLERRSPPGMPYRAAVVVATWTDLYSALWPQNVAKSGIVLGFAKSVEARSPLIAGAENDAVHSTNLAARSRRSPTRVPSLTKLRASSRRPSTCSRVASTTRSTSPGGERLHAPARAEAPLHRAVRSPAVDLLGARTSRTCSRRRSRWFDHYLKGAPNGIDKTKPVDDRRCDRFEANVVRGHPEDEDDHRRLPRDDARAAPRAEVRRRRSRRSAPRAPRAGAKGRSASRGSSRRAARATA